LLPRYNFTISEDGSYKFTTDLNHHYLIYFTESQISDSERNSHTLYNLGFSRDGDFSCEPFTGKYDSKIRNTILFILHDFFVKNDHRVLIYFCFGEDGYSRHRKIVFSSWCKLADIPVAKYDSIIRYEETDIYGSLIIFTGQSFETFDYSGI
jgi:hypothetical protein